MARCEISPRYRTEQGRRRWASCKNTLFHIRRNGLDVVDNRFEIPDAADTRRTETPVHRHYLPALVSCAHTRYRPSSQTLHLQSVHPFVQTKTLATRTKCWDQAGAGATAGATTVQCCEEKKRPNSARASPHGTE